MASTPPTAAAIADAAKHGTTWVKVKAPRLTFALGNGDYSLSAGDWTTMPTHAVRQMQIDGMIE